MDARRAGAHTMYPGQLTLRIDSRLEHVVLVGLSLRAICSAVPFDEAGLLVLLQGGRVGGVDRQHQTRPPGTASQPLRVTHQGQAYASAAGVRYQPNVDELPLVEIGMVGQQ